MDICRRTPARLALGICLAFVVLAAVPGHAAKAAAKAPAGKNRELVVLDHERWLDTLKGTVKNFSKASARDVTLVVRFHDKKNKMLGSQRVNVGDLRSGDESAWTLPISEKHRPATRYTFQVHAIWQ
jgi:hypothetical protein